MTPLNNAADHPGRPVRPSHLAEDTTMAEASPLGTDASQSGSARTEPSTLFRRRAGQMNDRTTTEKADHDTDSENAHKGKTRERSKSLLHRLDLDSTPSSLAWVKPTLTSWARLKPVLRSALIAWIMLLLMVINPAENVLGVASFLVLVFAFIQPAELPLSGVIEREVFMLVIGLACWAWCCLAIKIAYAARDVKIPATEASTTAILAGQYIERGPSLVCAIFLAVGAAANLYLKIRFGPSPFLFASIIGCIHLDITLTTAALYPYPHYLLGKAIMIPLAVKSAVTLIISCIFFPKSVNSLFVDRVVAVLLPLGTALRGQLEQFDAPPLDPNFDFLRTRNTIGQSERAVPLLSAASRLLSREITFGLANGKDLRKIERLVKDVLAPANGFSQYFTLIHNDISCGHFPQRSAPPTRPPSPSRTPMASRPATLPRRSGDAEVSEHRDETRGRTMDSEPRTPRGTESLHDKAFRKSHFAHGGHGPHHHRLTQLLHRVQLHSHLRHSPRRAESPSRSSIFGNAEPPPPVGTWDYLRFAELEERLHTKDADWITERIFRTLGEGSANILQTNAMAVDHVVNWLKSLNSQRYKLFVARFTSRNPQIGTGRPTLEVIDEVEKALAHFRAQERLVLIEPFKEALLQPAKGLPHRYLFQAWVHQHTSLVFTDRLLDLLRMIDVLERERSRGRLWLPSLPRMLRLEAWETQEEGSDDHETASLHDPEVIDQAPGDEWYRKQFGMGGAAPRDPDALEPSGPWELIGKRIHDLCHRCLTGNLLFAVKAAGLTGLVSLPFFLSASAGWAYRNKGIWTLIMSQLTLSRHRGESIFALVSRLMSTFFGAAVGLIIWYMADGSHSANRYGLLVVWGAFSIPMMAVRLYWPVPISGIIGTVTVSLVVGYSWKDQNNPFYGPGRGWDVAWRRFLEVLIGASAAVIWSFLPPSSTLRQYLRRNHAASIHRAGALHCRLLAFTANHDVTEVDPSRLSADLISHRQKLRRLDVLKNNVAYESSLRGRWPTERYQNLFEVQLQLSKLLSAAVIVAQRLGPAYSRALLRRTRFANEGFTADVMTLYSSCSSALRTAQPLPQLSPVLFSRYLSDSGFSFSTEPMCEDEEEILGLPRELNAEVLASEQYLTFAVGVMTLSAIVLKLDSLLLAVKELVGESYSLPPELCLHKGAGEGYTTAGDGHRPASRHGHGNGNGHVWYGLATPTGHHAAGSQASTHGIGPAHSHSHVHAHSHLASPALTPRLEQNKELA